MSWEVFYFREAPMCLSRTYTLWCLCRIFCGNVRSFLCILSFNYCISMLTFCSDDLSLGKSGELKSSTVIGLMLICVYNSVSTCFVKFGVPQFGTYLFRTVMSSWLNVPISYMICPSSSIWFSLVLKSILSEVGITVPAFFLVNFNWSIFFHLFTLRWCLSFNIKLWFFYNGQ